MYAVRMKTEYLYEPIGIDYKRPRLFWNCADGKKQSAYQIVTETDKGGAALGQWKSGKRLHEDFIRGKRDTSCNKSNLENKALG